MCVSKNGKYLAITFDDGKLKLIDSNNILNEIQINDEWIDKLII